MKDRKNPRIEQQKQKTSAKKNKILTAGSIIILIFSAITFIFIPAMTDSLKKQLPPFGKYNGKPIKYESGSEFAQMVEYYEQQEKNRGRQLDESAYFQIFSNAFSTTAINMAFADEVKKSGYIPSDKLIDRTMLPYFYDSENKFSARIYRDTPDAKKIELRQQITQSLITQKYARDIFGSGGAQSNEPAYGIKSSEAEQAFIRSMQRKERAFRMAVFSKDAFPASEAAAFGREHPELFQKLNLSVVTVETESEAKKISAQLKRNEITFDDAAKEFSNKAHSDEDGVLTENFAYQIKNILTGENDLNRLCALAENETSDVIQTKEGYSLFRCFAAPEDADFSNAEMQSAVDSYMKLYEAGRIEDFIIAQAKDFAAAAVNSGFADAGKKFGIEVVSVPPFSMNYGNNPLLSFIDTAAAPALQNAETNEHFLKTAFSLKEREISEPLVLGSNVIVLQLSEETEKADDADSFAYIFPYYVSQFDQSAVQQFFMTSKKLENNFISVYFSNFMN
ncbi:MAG: peptidylprolyl isomerase [Bacteroides sp.]|nr:peptidylprolyl isomerase [Prevotella sp.]MCM1408340.1 peptidylprolyl isomerase [Treponema brennaborense]MCM1470428.1 peptidylprolyl isomerase [Bacteroides sp.]